MHSISRKMQEVYQISLNSWKDMLHEFREITVFS